MKKLLKLFLLLFLNNVLIAQNNNQINVSTPNINVLCVGLDNHVTIETIDGKMHDFVFELYICPGYCFEPDFKSLVKYVAATIIKEGAQRYNIHINIKAGNLLLLIKDKINGNDSIYGWQHYRVVNVPIPNLDLGKAHKSGGTCDLMELKKLKRLNVKIENLPRTDLSYKVLSYKFTVLGRKTSGPKTFQANSASLEPIKDYLKMLGPGDFIQFSDISIIGPGNKVLLLQNFGSMISGGPKGIFRELDQLLQSDSIDNKMFKLSYDIDYSRNAKLTNPSLVKNLVEYFIFNNFNDQLFKKNFIKYEFIDGRFENYVFNESVEINKKKGLVFRDTITTIILNSDVDVNNYDPLNDSNYHDTSFVDINSRRLNRIYFDETLNNITNIKEWYLFAEYNQRTIAIPISEFLKERVIFPQIVANYLGYLKKNNYRQYNKYRVFYNRKNYIDSISKGRIDFFENAANFQLQKLNFKLVTGNINGFHDVYMGDTYDTAFLKSWNKLMDWDNFKSLTNHAPEWYNSDSILSFSSNAISHTNLIKGIQEQVITTDKITGKDSLYHFIPLDKNTGFDVLSKINGDGSTTSLLMVRFNKSMTINGVTIYTPIIYYTLISKVFGLFDDVEKIMISDIYKFGYLNLDILKN